MERTVETAFEELDQIINQLEGGEKPLEESFQLYKKGMELVKFCSDKIDRVEKQLIILNEGTGDEDADQ